MNIIDQNKQVFNPLQRFIKIDSGICPDCDKPLSNFGYCADCHITPALDPDFQQWLGGTWTDTDGNTYTVNDTPHGPTVTATTPDGYTATSHTARDALAGAMAQRREAAKSYVYNTATLARYASAEAQQ